MNGRGLTELALLAMLVVCTPALADTSDDPSALLRAIQASAPSAQSTRSQTLQPGDEVGYTTFRIEEEKSRRVLILTLIGAAIASLVIVLWFLRLSGTASAGAIVNGSGLVLVVYATILVVNIARADQQLTAAMGILGAIAGYLFGTATGGVAQPPSSKAGSGEHDGGSEPGLQARR